MDREKYLISVKSILDADNLRNEILDFAGEMGRKCGDDFAGFGVNTHGGMRDAFIDLIQDAYGDTDKYTDYLIHEVTGSPNGGNDGRVEFPCGKYITVDSPEAAWEAIQFAALHPHDTAGDG